MPYIEPSYRKRYDNLIDALARELRNAGIVAGDINYVVFRLILKLWKSSPRYSTWVMLGMGVRDAVDEFRRRYIGPYEDIAIHRHGDVE